VLKRRWTPRTGGTGEGTVESGTELRGSWECQSSKRHSIILIPGNPKPIIPLAYLIFLISSSDLRIIQNDIKETREVTLKCTLYTGESWT
jgi:hypothetical protein